MAELGTGAPLLSAPSDEPRSSAGHLAGCMAGNGRWAFPMARRSAPASRLESGFPPLVPQTQAHARMRAQDGTGSKLGRSTRDAQSRCGRPRGSPRVVSPVSARVGA